MGIHNQAFRHKRGVGSHLRKLGSSLSSFGFDGFDFGGIDLALSDHGVKFGLIGSELSELGQFRHLFALAVDGVATGAVALHAFGRGAIVLVTLADLKEVEFGPGISGADKSEEESDDEAEGTHLGWGDLGV